MSKLIERQRICTHPIDDLFDIPCTQRHGWIRSKCGHCGKFMGYRPEDCDLYYKQKRSALKAKGRDRD